MDSKLANIKNLNIDNRIADIREGIAKSDRVTIEIINTQLESLKELGVANTILEGQGITMAEVSQLISDARARLKGTLAFDEIKFRMNTGAPIEKKLIMYQTEDGIKQGVMMNYRDTEGIYVAPYTGKETLQDLRDKSKWITFTISEVPYKLFDIKSTPPVTATPDIEQQSDALMSEAEKTEAAEAEKLKKVIEDDKFKNQSMDDVENDTFDPLQDCPF